MQTERALHPSTTGFYERARSQASRPRSPELRGNPRQSSTGIQSRRVRDEVRSVDPASGTTLQHRARESGSPWPREPALPTWCRVRARSDPSPASHKSRGCRRSLGATAGQRPSKVRESTGFVPAWSPGIGRLRGSSFPPGAPAPGVAVSGLASTQPGRRVTQPGGSRVHQRRSESPDYRVRLSTSVRRPGPEALWNRLVRPAEKVTERDCDTRLAGLGCKAVPAPCVPWPRSAMHWPGVPRSRGGSPFERRTPPHTLPSPRARTGRIPSGPVSCRS